MERAGTRATSPPSAFNRWGAGLNSFAAASLAFGSLKAGQAGSCRPDLPEAKMPQGTDIPGLRGAAAARFTSAPRPLLTLTLAPRRIVRADGRPSRQGAIDRPPQCLTVHEFPAPGKTAGRHCRGE